MNIRLEVEQLFYQSYPFERYARTSQGPIIPKDIREILPDRHPPEMVTWDKEVLFVTAESREILREWAQRYGIPLSDRLDIWSWLNEPFLDTVYTPEQEENTLKLLAENGISPEETHGIRQKIQSHMLIYNGFLWEWVHLGHYDVLLSRKKYSLRRLTNQFYRWTMEISVRNLRQ